MRKWRWYLVFFFFKQKTAYEMRISDWSSGVCSSDLRAHRAQHVQIGVAVIVGMNAALQADLGRTPISGLRGAPPHLLEIEHIGWTAQVLRRPFRKGAEAAFVKADIGVIDIAVDDVGHRIATIGSASCRERVVQ